MKSKLRRFTFDEPIFAGLFIAAGGFEDRCLTFSKKIRKPLCFFRNALLMRYSHRTTANLPNTKKLADNLTRIIDRKPTFVTINPDRPILSFMKASKVIEKFALTAENRSVWIDISSMTHFMALSTIDICLNCGLRTNVVYTEANSYFPSKKHAALLAKAWKTRDYELAAKFLQSAGLKGIEIGPKFSGNFRSGAQTCLVIFTGFEPNRVQGLVDLYAPGAIVVYYGESPHAEMAWRTGLSKSLHEDTFSQWRTRCKETSTLEVDEIVRDLEREFAMIRGKFDVAIAPQGSKMQALASYMFWRRHPEVQLIFTSPVRFNPKVYSKGSGNTYVYEID